MTLIDALIELENGNTVIDPGGCIYRMENGEIYYTYQCTLWNKLKALPIIDGEWKRITLEDHQEKTMISNQVWDMLHNGETFNSLTVVQLHKIREILTS